MRGCVHDEETSHMHYSVLSSECSWKAKMNTEAQDVYHSAAVTPRAPPGKRGRQILSGAASEKEDEILQIFPTVIPRHVMHFQFSFFKCEIRPVPASNSKLPQAWNLG